MRGLCCRQQKCLRVGYAGNFLPSSKDRQETGNRVENLESRRGKRLTMNQINDF